MEEKNKEKLYADFPEAITDYAPAGGLHESPVAKPKAANAAKRAMNKIIW